ncbi:MAG: tRNA (N(6)-L-threonylcarbamoyladenosine(37)-C(2))-methylthiotransferase MtaB [Holosporales bacterium]|jgi:threonylcarbamoyladenosine tRNA methylthiotransferase MtaB|nr:tRNA (N(6)-L-threonylcarbamoyladenosine(37)-C(2))-methylthiotransferase MtaB [Holosporales bacterium]
MVRVVTFGCRMNAMESELLLEQARKIGKKNLVIVNSCAVTKEAERQARQEIRKIAKENPAAHIVVTGCAGTLHAAAYASLPNVLGVIHNEQKLDFPSWQALTRKIPENPSGKPESSQEPLSSRARTYVAIQNGCNHCCSYCIVPYTRGPSRSAPLEKIVAETRAAVQKGYPEVVLTGVDIASYSDACGLGPLVRRLLREVPELPQLRLSSLDPAGIDEDLLEAFATEQRLMPHLHMSLQSGSSAVLRDMRRRHTPETVQKLCERLRLARPEILFGADLIAGFPTEQAEHTEETLHLLAEVGVTLLHVFPYSVRPHTPAASLPLLPRSTVLTRARRLRLWGAEALRSQLASYVGQTLPILMETSHQGRAPQFLRVQSASPATPRSIVTMRIVGATETTLIAKQPYCPRSASSSAAQGKVPL